MTPASLCPPRLHYGGWQGQPCVLQEPQVVCPQPRGLHLLGIIFCMWAMVSCFSPFLRQPGRGESRSPLLIDSSAHSGANTARVNAVPLPLFPGHWQEMALSGAEARCSQDSRGTGLSWHCLFPSPWPSAGGNLAFAQQSGSEWLPTTLLVLQKHISPPGPQGPSVHIFLPVTDAAKLWLLQQFPHYPVGCFVFPPCTLLRTHLTLPEPPASPELGAWTSRDFGCLPCP